MNEALARLERVISADLLYAPAHAAFGVRFTRAEAGLSVARMPVVGALDDGDRSLAAGGTLVLFDALLGSSVASSLPAGSAMTTLTMHLQFIGLAHPGGEWLQGTGRCVAVDRASALSTAEITTADGRLVAIGSSRCVVLPSAATDPMAEPGDGQPPGELGAWRRSVTVEAGGAVGRARAHERWANPRGHVQGGAVAMVAERTLHELWRPHDLDAADCFDLDITFLRALPADGREITCRAELGHRGRSLATARAEVYDGDRVVAELGASRYHRAG